METSVYDIESSVQSIEDIKESFAHYLPELILAGLMMLILLLHLIFRKKKAQHQILVITSVLGLLIVAFLSMLQFDNVRPSPSSGNFLNSLVVSIFSIQARLVIIISAILTILLSLSSSVFEKKVKGEYYFLLLAMVLGLDLILLANNFLVLYLAIELVSIASYIITVFYFNKKSAEAGIKYLLFGAMASAIMLYGISFLYGITYNLDMRSMLMRYWSASHTVSYQGIFTFDKVDFEMLYNPLLWKVALVLFFGGLFFKLSMFPFHLWTPDIYESAPTPIVAFFSIAPKIAIFWILLYFVAYQIDNVYYFILIITFLTLLVGNFSALWQQNIKRLFAYSAIAQIGFIALLLFSKTDKTTGFISFYFLVYMMAIFGIFLMIDIVAKQVKKQNTDIYLIEHYKGLGQKYPFLGISVLIFMLVLVGLPPTSGFLAKVFIFSAVWDAYIQTQNIALLGLFLFALFMTVVSLFYYLKVPFLMFFRKPENEEILDIQLNLREYILIGVLAFLSLLFFFVPQIIL